MDLVFCILNWEIWKHAHIINRSYTHIPSHRPILTDFTVAQNEQHKKTA